MEYSITTRRKALASGKSTRAPGFVLSSRACFSIAIIASPPRTFGFAIQALTFATVDASRIAKSALVLLLKKDSTISWNRFDFKYVSSANSEMLVSPERIPDRLTSCNHSRTLLPANVPRFSFELSKVCFNAAHAGSLSSSFV